MSHDIDRNPESIQIYIEKSDKAAFKRACWLCDSTMSRELRRFIREYTKNPPIPDREYHPLTSSPYEK